MERASWTIGSRGATSFSFPAVFSSGMLVIREPLSATIRPNLPAATRAVAAVPRRAWPGCGRASWGCPRVVCSQGRSPALRGLSWR